MNYWSEYGRDRYERVTNALERGAEVSRRTGIRTTRLHELTNNPKSNVKATELYLIALAIEADPAELLEYVCKDLELKGES